VLFDSRFCCYRVRVTGSSILETAQVFSGGTASEGRSDPSAALAVAGLWILIPFLVVIPVGPSMPAARVVGGMTVGLLIFLLEGLAVAFAIYRRDRPLFGSAVMLALISAIVRGFAAARKLEMLNWIWSFYVLAPGAFAASALYFPAIGAGTRAWLRFGSIDWNVGQRIALVVASHQRTIQLSSTLLFAACCKRSSLSHPQPPPGDIGRRRSGGFPQFGDCRRHLCWKRGADTTHLHPVVIGQSLG
jgi:hypothetical protein